VDVRIIAATNRHLEDEVTTGRFREDLFYRLNVLAMRLPPLRERQEDIPPLVEHFVQALSKNMGMEPPEVRESDLMRMMDYEWPGNVRELRNVIERCLLLGSSPGECLVTGDRSDKDEESEFTLEAVEKRHILKVLGMEDGNKSAAARRLGIARKTLERKLKEWGLMGG